MRNSVLLKHPSLTRGLGWSLITIGLVLLALLLWRLTVTDSSTTADRTAIRGTIQAQIDAFRTDDAERAFSFASPAIQDHFRTPEQFMARIMTSYRSVYRPRAVFFQDGLIIDDLATQRVLFVNQEDSLIIATYLMQRQQNGAWRIAGCYLTPAAGKVL